MTKRIAQALTPSSMIEEGLQKKPIYVEPDEIALQPTHPTIEEKALTLR